MKRSVLQKLYREKLRVQRRLEQAIGGMQPRDDCPEFSTEAVTYEMADRTRAISAGGIGAIHQMVNSIGIREAIDENLSLLQRPSTCSTSPTMSCVAEGRSMTSS